MRGFSHRATVTEAWDWIAAATSPIATHEQVGLVKACGRVLAIDIISKVDVPQFRRAMMDGYALQAHATLGATEYNLLKLSVIGEALPGAPFVGSINRSQAVRIMTGAPVPDSADAVLPVELTSRDGSDVAIQGSVPPQKNVGIPGEDIRRGHRILKAGRQLRPQDIGLISSIGMDHVPVLRSPLVNLIVTGNELLPPGATPAGSKIVDSNSPMLAGLVDRDGGIFRSRGIIEDKPDAILQAMREDADIILISGGSSVGQEDHAPQIVAEHGNLAIHGIAIRPSSPAGMGTFDGKPVFLLPGNPVSCLCAYDFFAGRAIRSMAGRSASWPYRSVRLPLARKLVSAIGRTDYARVVIESERVEPIAISGASVLSSTTRADGFVVVPSESEGFDEGAVVEVELYG